MKHDSLSANQGLVGAAPLERIAIKWNTCKRDSARKNIDVRAFSDSGRTENALDARRGDQPRPTKARRPRGRRADNAGALLSPLTWLVIYVNVAGIGAVVATLFDTMAMGAA